MNSILTRALMKYHNEFFTMSYTEQEAWKLEDHSEIDKKVRTFIEKEIGQTDEDEHNDEKNYEFNVIYLEYVGIGKNHFMLNDFNWNTETVSYGNLYDYNVYYHDWQEEAMADGFSEHKPKELYNRWASWARALVDDKFHYLNLDSLQIWITWKLETVISDWIDERIPHDYVSGPDDGKKVDGGFIWDMKIDAAGKEGWYEQMRDFGYEWTNAKYDNTPDLGDVVFKVDTTEKFYDPTIDYVFGSMNVLKDLTFVNFVDDAENVKGDNQVLFDYLAEVTTELLEDLEVKYQEVLKTPSDVVKKKKRRDIVMSDDALEDLEGIIDDE